jgi:hypothetical protein
MKDRRYSYTELGMLLGLFVGIGLALGLGLGAAFDGSQRSAKESNDRQDKEEQ